MANKRENINVNYLSRDFASIKNDLIQHAKRYYPETFKDFSDAGFGALMVDAVSYIGDILSFYLDYQANESFLSTALEYNNIIKHGEAVGFRYDNVRTTYGQVELYIKCPPNSVNTGPDLSYAPKLRQGSTFTNNAGSSFSLLAYQQTTPLRRWVRLHQVNFVRQSMILAILLDFRELQLTIPMLQRLYQ